jgi:hypothetical protein
MPCYTVQTATVQFGKNTDPELLRKALFSAGIFEYNYAFDRATGELTLNTRDESKIGQVKRLYSEQVLEHTAKRNGWRLTWSTNAAGNRVAETERLSR